ncbi:MAG: peptidoglycan DD-metalloendopeptidase family protein, partial [Acidimicrobiales bacterium]
MIGSSRAALERRLLRVLVAVALLAGTPAAAGASPMPPQLPSAEEMARLQGQLQAALKEVRGAQATLDALVEDFERARNHLEQIAGEIQVAEERIRILEAEVQAAQAAMNKRAGSVYRSERLALVNVLLAARTFREFVSAVGMMRSVAVRDARVLDRVRQFKAEAARMREELEGRRIQQQALIEELGQRQKKVEASLATLGRKYEKVKAEVQKRKAGFAFPVRAPYSYTDSWGAPRMVGTKYYHRHEGTDVFALRGTPLVAVVDGVVERVGVDVLGGIKLWLRSPGDEWTYFYAHLTGYARGIANGVHVRKGEVLGFVGNTGNARGTPPHLHFETHVPSGAPINSYPIL